MKAKTRTSSRKHAAITFLLLGLHFIFLQRAFGQVGDLDISFGNGGLVVQDAGSDQEAGHAVVVQPDGKIVVAGLWKGPSDFETILLRYHADGSLDPSFGTGGIAITDTTDSLGYVTFGIAILPDGKILAVGQAIDAAGIRFLLLRFHADGSLDDGFGTGGAALVGVGGGTSAGFEVAVQPDGKILVGGYSNDGVQDNMTILRFHPDGSLDNTFDGDGVVVTNIGNDDSRGYVINLTPDGKIVVVGRMTNGSTTNIAVVRYNPDGSLDPSFGGDGVSTTQISSVSDIYLPLGAAVQPDGKVLVTTNSYMNINEGFALLRYNTDGSLDSQFGNNGKALTAIGSFDVARKTTVQPDGKILVAGYSNFNPQAVDMVLLRYNANGELDTQFGVEGLGLIIADINSQADIALSMALQPDGKILLAGNTSTNNISDIAVLRFLSSPTSATVSPAAVLGLHFYPNPVLETGKLAYELSESTTLSARLYDHQGRLLKTLWENETKAAGKHQENISFPTAMPAGNYLLILETEKGKTGVKVLVDNRH